MDKKIFLIFLSASIAFPAFAESSTIIKFGGEIYENTCDLDNLELEEKCILLNKKISLAHVQSSKEISSPEKIRASVQDSDEIYTTFYAASLKSLKDHQATNLEIHYK